MNELAIQPDEISVFDPPKGIQDQISILLESIVNNELNLARGYARLGRLLWQVQKTGDWRDWGYESFNRFVSTVGEKINRAKSQIYAYVSVAERLLPYVSDENLEAMGISRATELAKFVKQSGRPLSRNLLVAALDPTIKLDQLHTDVLEELHEKGEAAGTWWEFQGMYLLPDEKREIQAAIETAKRIDEDILQQPDHIQRKLIMLAWAREFVSSNPP